MTKAAGKSETLSVPFFGARKMARKLLSEAEELRCERDAAV
jgi:hypothetical protein